MKRTMGAVGRFDCLERHSSVAIDRVKKYAPPCGQGEYKRASLLTTKHFILLCGRLFFRA